METKKRVGGRLFGSFRADIRSSYPQPIINERVYKLFAVKFCGTGLNAIRDEFVKRVQTGLRRYVFIVDMDEEVRIHEELRAKNALETGKKREPPLDLLKLTMAAVERCKSEYDSVTRTIEKEQAFDLTSYWLKHLSARKKSEPVKRQGSKSAKRESCPMLQPQEHNIIGRPSMLSKRKYINDEPEYSKLFIILIGHLDPKFYMTLLESGEPLQAIIHFLPGETGYDILLPHPENKEFILRTIKDIQNEAYELRQIVNSKPLGILQQELPVISRCLAEKYSDDIFDQLSHYIYDVEMLYRQYQLYYLRCFEEVNVKMPPGVSMVDYLSTAESLSLQGHFLLWPLPAFSADMPTIVMYLESLLNTLGPPDEVLTEKQTLLLSLPAVHSGFYTEMIDVVREFQVAFASITKIDSYGRVVIEEPNRLLRKLVSYVESKTFHDIYLTCLEYNILRKYVASGYLRNTMPYQPFNNDNEPFYLPPYVKLYPSTEAVIQNLTRWLVKYENCNINEIHPGYRLYHFKRVYNEIIENQDMMILPTRLCFRDFTLFEMEEFLRVLVTPEFLLEQLKASMTEEERFQKFFLSKSIFFDDNIFIRPKSLKTRKFKDKTLSFHTASEGKLDSDEQTMETPKQRLSMQDEAGLPPDHPMLYGYNLEDIRQEITVKTSKYYFEEGSLLLCEERWCFTDMNKYMNMKINRTQLNLVRPRGADTGVSSNLRLTVRKDISVRIMNTSEECAKVVINYPNGLTIYHHETYAEQEWYPAETFNNERRRIYTPYGAIIVMYKDLEQTLVMRYNGEVYQLYQYELEGEEEEMMEEGFDDDKIENKDSSIKKSHKSKSKMLSDKSKSKLTLSGKSKSKITFSSSSHGASSISLKAKKEAIKQSILASVENEFKFLGFLCKEYNLSYLHLILTTSNGKHVNITHKGKVYRGRSKPTHEWHDYFANESYAMRGDGVRMIWTKDTLKCYHKDGTLITTQTEEGIERMDWDSEHMSESSSHEDEGNELSPEQTIRNKTSAATNSTLAHKPGSRASSYKRQLKRSVSFEPYMMSEEEGGEVEEVVEDISYITYICDSYLVQHKHYAEVHITLIDELFNSINVDITGIYDIRVQIFKEFPYAEILLNEMDDNDYLGASNSHIDHDTDVPQTPVAKSTTRHQTEVSKSSGTHVTADTSPTHTHKRGTHKRSSQNAKASITPEIDNSEVPPPEEEPDITKTIVKIWIGGDLYFCVTNEGCQIDALLTRYDAAEGDMRENITFNFKFEENIASIFHNFAENIAQFKNYQGTKTKEFYFLEKTINECRRQGFEFFKELPPPSKYNFSAANTFTEFKEIKTNNEKMQNVYAWYKYDMKKFPRFPVRKKKTHDPKVEFPQVISATTYCQIPRLLTNTEEIEKFLAPFDEITFKRTRSHITDALEYYLRPFIRVELAKLWSKNNWVRRHLEHSRRRFREQQRKGLYHAMLKHKVFPKYHQFMVDFHRHVKNIEFFDFVRSRCEVKKSPAEELAEQLSKAKSVNRFGSMKSLIEQKSQTKSEGKSYDAVSIISKKTTVASAMPSAMPSAMHPAMPSAIPTQPKFKRKQHCR